MNKAIISVTAIISISCLFGWYLYLQNSRYDLIGTQQGIAYEVDRKTGTTWTLYPGSKEICEDSGKGADRGKLHKFTNSEITLVTGNAKLKNGWFSGKLYNGSELKVKEVIFAVETKDKDGKVRWLRKYKESISIPPFSTKSFDVTVSGEEGFESFTWGILDVYGEKAI